MLLPALAGALLGLALCVSRAIGARRVDLLIATGLYTVGLALCRLLGPLVSLTGYREYTYYLQGLPSSGARGFFPVWRALLARDPSFGALFDLTSASAALLPVVSYGVALALGTGRWVAVGSALLLLASSSFLAYGPGASTMMQLAAAATSASFVMHAALRPGRRPALRQALTLLAAVLGFVAWLTKPEGVLVSPLLLLMIALERRLAVRPRVDALVSFSLSTVLLWLWGHSLVVDELVPFLVTRVTERGPTMLEEWFQALFFLVANAYAVGLLTIAYVAWRHREWRSGRTTLLIPVVGYSALYACGADHFRHQLVLLPIFLPLTLAALRQLMRHRSRMAVPILLGFCGWIVAVGITSAFAYQHDPKQREYEGLQAELPGRGLVYHLPYAVGLSRPEAPLLTLAGASTRVVALRPPEGCPRDLFLALGVIHHACSHDRKWQRACREAIRDAPGDWVVQADNLSRLLGPALRTLMSQARSERDHRDDERETQGQDLVIGEAEGDARQALFVPIWARSRRYKFFHHDRDLTTEQHDAREALLAVVLQLRNDTTAWRFPQFGWMGAAELALEFETASIRADGPPLVAATVRTRAAQRDACLRVRARTEGARLFELLESLPDDEGLSSR